MRIHVSMQVRESFYGVEYSSVVFRFVVPGHHVA